MSSVPMTDEIIEMELYDGTGEGSGTNEGTFGVSNSNGPGSVKKTERNFTSPKTRFRR